MDEKSKGVGKTRKFLWGFRFWVWFFLLSAALGVVGAFLSVSGSSDVQDFETSQIFRRIVVSTSVVAGILFFAILLSIPRFIRRFVRWLFSWRMIRRYLITLAGLIALVVLFYAQEDVRGKWAWEKYKRAWEAKGEKFEFASLAPPPVPDNQNFAMTPLLRPIFDYVRVTNSTESRKSADESPQWEYSMEWRDSNAYARVRSIDAWEVSQRQPTNLFSFGNLDRGTFANLEDLRAFYLDNENYPQPANSANAAGVILTALSKFDPEFKELEAAAATHPDCRFPLEYNLELPDEILLPQFPVVKNISLCADVRAVAELELRRSQDAFTNLLIGFRMADSVKAEPLLLSQLVRMAALEKNLQTIREGLARHAWDYEQLRELESRLASIDLIVEGRAAMRGERAYEISNLNFYRRNKWNPKLQFVYYLGFGDGANFWIRFTPDGWFYQSNLSLARLFQNYVLSAIDESAHRIFPKTIGAGEGFYIKRYKQPYHFLAAMLVPGMARDLMIIAKTQTYVDAARLACALERLRLANGHLPEKLEALVPRYLAKISNDVIDGQPLRYRLESDGNYIIYSIGWNQTDDGGVRGGKPLGPNGWLWSAPEEGDWVWTLAAR